MAEKFKVGRYVGGAVEPAFTLERTDGGGIRFSDVKSLSDSERSYIMSHFGRPQRAMLGIAAEQHLRTLQPGTPIFFEAAVTTLPAPFVLMAGANR